MERELTFEVLKIVCPRGNAEIMRNVVLYEDLMIERGIVGIRKQYFLAQIAHESDGFKTTEEYASGRAYEGRKDLGNVHEGDGERFKGRGLIQLTGRENYRKFGKRIGKDLEAYPEVVAKFPFAMMSAVDFWVMNGLNSLADRKDFLGVTKRINGGTTGWDWRCRYLDLFKKLGVGEDSV
jgi:putative chitinase